ncbi:MAG: metal-binding protein [Chloroflexi bacterium]|nr:metal-binding protein [Chloroflexota bacterium]OJW02784.1 MAG: hypothetical protein BGO39_06045 [Chloroflexi bacterium 54-19]
MPMGTTHRRLNTALSVPLAAGTLWLKWDAGFVVSLLAGYHFATYFMNPDLDLNSLGYKSWGWLRFIWWPYQKVLAHRCFLSHFPVISTLLRVIYLLWFPALLLLVFGGSVQAAARDAIFDWFPVTWPFLLVFVIGMIISDSLHAIFDTSSTELKRLFRGSRRRKRARDENFFEHHNQAPPAWAYRRTRSR